ncbi:MAG: HAD family hydrolase [Actinomycetota bacterium]|nr:HAD family hydrolase [Actinomycetota bacterium]
MTLATPEIRTPAPAGTPGLHSTTPNSAVPITAVCLDIDDTLVDYGSSVRAGLREMLGADDAWPAWCATTERHYPRFTAGEVDFDTMRRQRTQEFFAARGELLDDAEAMEREDQRMTAMRRAWRLFDDALPCLRWLRAVGLRLAAVTNAASRHQRAKLQALDLETAFDAVVISDEVGAAKPDPVIFHTACAALGVRPAHAVHVGDRLDLDAQGARAAGLHAVWLDRSRRADRARPAEVTLISGLAELPRVVTGLGADPTAATRTGVGWSTPPPVG